MEKFKLINTRKLEIKTKSNLINLVLQTIKINKQVLVFNNSKRSSEKTADDISIQISNPLDKEKLLEISNKILGILSSPTKQCKRLAKNIEKGIAFHHSGLSSKQRTIVEKAFKEGLIKVISCTPTLAAGLNMPAYKVIIKDYKRYSQRGFNDIPVLEFHQMTGRAGRPGKEKIGKAVLLVKSEKEFERVIPKYLFGKPEEILSKLAVEPILKMYMLSLVSMDLINTEKEIIDFFSNTFYAHQYKDLEGLKFNLFRILKILIDYGFISQIDTYYRVTPIGKKVSELYLNPDTANYFYSNLDKFSNLFSKKTFNSFDIYSLLFFISDTLEMRPLFRVSKAEEDSYSQKAEDIGDNLVLKFDPFEMDYSHFLNTIKTAEILEDWINESHEDFMNNKYNVTPGELSYKMDVADWLLYCLEEMSLMKKHFFFRNYITKLRKRFKFGIKEELLTLISLKGIGRVRARKLFDGGFKTLDDLRNADLNLVANIIGNNLTIKIRKEIDSDFDEINAKAILKPKEIRMRNRIDDESKNFKINSLNKNDSNKIKKEEDSKNNLKRFF